MPDSATIHPSADSAAHAARRRMIGELVHSARESSGRRTKDLADFLTISPAMLNAIEAGEKEPTLPMLEAIACFLQVPVHSFFGLHAIPRQVDLPADAGAMMRLRGHIIGARLRQRRLQRCESLAECAQAVGTTTKTIKAWEIGSRQPSLLELEKLLTHLDLSLSDMLDLGIGLLGELQLRQVQQMQFEALPAELRAFVCDPAARDVLQFAARMRQLSREELRAMADAFEKLAGPREQLDRPSGS